MKFSVKFQPGIPQLKEVKHSTEEELKSWEIPFMDMMDILLAIDESITNIITHGYKKVKSSDGIQLEIIRNNNEIVIKITDNGRIFDFESTPAPDIRKNLSGKKKGGFGVHLIKSVMDEAHHIRSDEKNILILKKILKPAK